MLFSALLGIRVCFWAFWIHIRIWFRILPSSSKNSMNKIKNFLSLKPDVNVPSHRNEQPKKPIFGCILKATEEKSRIRIQSWIRMSVVRICGSPDPYQIVSDHQHWYSMSYIYSVAEVYPHSGVPYPRIRIRTRTKMSRIPNTGRYS